MKKFLSLLLALTMVLSLTVVPARANDSSSGTPTQEQVSLSTTASENKIDRGSSAEITVTKPQDANHQDISWSSSAPTVASVSTSTNGATVRGLTAGSATITYSYKESAEATEAKTATIQITVVDKLLVSDITSVTFDNSRTYPVTNGAANVVKLDGDDFTTAGKWTANAINGYTIESASFSFASGSSTSGTLTLTATTGSPKLTTTININSNAASYAIEATPNPVLSGGTVSLRTKDSNLSSGATYAWSYKEKVAQDLSFLSLHPLLGRSRLLPRIPLIP